MKFKTVKCRVSSIFLGTIRLQAVYEQSTAVYTKLDWDIQARMIDNNRAAVRGRVKGLASGQKFDVAFTT